jgi:hypothetical protein
MRENLRGSVCRSWDTKIVMKKMQERFKIKTSELDSCFGIVSNRSLKPIFDKIRKKIDEYIEKVDKSYEIYNNLFIFLMDNLNSESQTKFREPPVEIVIDAISQQFKDLNSEEVSYIIYNDDEWNARTDADKTIIQDYVTSIKDLITENNINFTCSVNPNNNKGKLRDIYDTIDRSDNIMTDLKTRLGCAEPRIGGSKRKTIKQKQIKKKNRKTYKQYLHI